jgi:uncharacterized protein (TIGR03437 family)
MKRPHCPRTLLVALCLAALPAAAQLRTDVIYTKFEPTLYSLRKPVPVVFEVRVGTAIDSVTFCLPCGIGQAPVRMALNDQGTGGDRVAGDRTFSVTLQPATLAPFVQIDHHKIGGLVEASSGGTPVISVSSALLVLKDAPPVTLVQLNATTQHSRNVVNLRLTNAEFFGDAQQSPFVTKRFYSLFPDDFDMLNIVYQGSVFQNRTHTVVLNQVQGIGAGLTNATATFGSAGKLLGVSRFPIDSFFDVDQGRFGGRGFIHETGHQWLSYLPDTLLVGGIPHWPLSDLATGIMGFSDSVNRQGLGISGDFFPEGANFRLSLRYGIPQLTFKDLELYLMGMVPPSAVGSHFVFRNQNQLNRLTTGGLLDGPVDTFTVNDVIARNGPRVPNSAGAQKTFRMATLYLTLDRLATPDEMAYFDHATELMDGLFNTATLGVGHINPLVKNIEHYPVATKPEIHSVGAHSSGPAISRNGWIEIKGIGLAPAGTLALWNDAPDFAQGKMPTSLAGVSVKIGGKPAYVYFVSPNQINVLAGLDTALGTVDVEVIVAGITSDPFPIIKNAASPSLLYFGVTGFIAATHADGSLLGPAYLSVPGFTFTPAKAGETVVLYGVGFGNTVTPLTEGASTQTGSLIAPPGFQVGSQLASVRFAGLVAPGLFQFNIVIPSVPSGEVAVRVANSAGITTGLLAVE